MKNYSLSELNQIFKTEYLYNNLLEDVLEKNIDPLIYSNIFYLACQYGKLDMIILMYTEKYITVSDIKKTNYLAVRIVCEYGHLNILDWLYKLTNINIKSDDNYCLRKAASNGHHHIISWLYSKYSLTINDIKACSNEALQKACENKHLETVKWLCKKFPFTSSDIKMNTYAFDQTHIEIINYLCTTFNLKIECQFY